MFARRSGLYILTKPRHNEHSAGSEERGGAVACRQQRQAARTASHSGISAVALPMCSCGIVSNCSELVLQAHRHPRQSNICARPTVWRPRPPHLRRCLCGWRRRSGAAVPRPWTAAAATGDPAKTPPGAVAAAAVAAPPAEPVLLPQSLSAAAQRQAPQQAQQQGPRPAMPPPCGAPALPMALGWLGAGEERERDVDLGGSERVAEEDVERKCGGAGELGDRLQQHCES